MLCYSCESPKENSDCQINPNQTTTIMCETKQQVCYSKKTTNAAGRSTNSSSFFFSYIDLVCTFSRKTSTVQSRLLNATFIHNEQYSSTGTMYEQQSRRQNNMREILSNKSMQSPGHKVALFFLSFQKKKTCPQY